MGKIYAGSGNEKVKLNSIQVCEQLKGIMTDEHRQVIAAQLSVNGYEEDQHITNYKKFFAHCILDCYKNIPGTDDNTMEVKKCAKHLMEKYMKSSSNIDGEDSAYKLLMDDIMEVMDNAMEEK